MPVKTDSETTKYLSVRTALIQAIRSGEFGREGRLPSERELAQRFSVSYMTARRAVSAMVDENVLERRGRSGTYVRTEENEHTGAKLVHLLCADWHNSVSTSFVKHGARYLEANGWNHSVFYLRPGDELEAARLIDSDVMAIVLPHADGIKPVLLKSLLAAGDRVVVLGSQDHLGLPSVKADDAYAMRLAVTYLQEQGHRNIALVIDRPRDPIQRIQLATWRSCLESLISPTLDYDDLLVALEVPYFDNPSAASYEAVTTFLSHPKAIEVTALLCLGEDMALATIAACRDIGRPVPDDLSVVSVGHSTLMNLITPPVTSVEVSIARHVEVAFEMLRQWSEKGESSPMLLRFVEPQLIVRESVRRIAPPSNE